MMLVSQNATNGMDLLQLQSFLIDSAPIFANCDVYIPWAKSTTEYENSRIQFTAVKQVVPLDPNKVEPNQILDFRAHNQVARVEMYKAVNSILETYKDATSEADAERITHYLVDRMQQEMARIRKQYRQCRIDTGVKVFAGASVGLGIHGLFQSWLHLPLEATSEMIAAMALTLYKPLRDREEKHDTLRSDQWAFLWNLGQLER